MPCFYIDILPFRIYYRSTKKPSDFEWDPNKDELNQEKHGVSFSLAQLAFLDHKRIILEDLEHSDDENDFSALAGSLAGL